MTLAAMGWTVLHPLWQWTLIGAAASLALGFLRHARAQTRYLVVAARWSP